MQPQSIEAERSVIGGILLAPESWDAIAEQVNASDFYRPEHRAIFRQIALLVDRNEPIDVITVADRLLATGELDAAGGHTYLTDLVSKRQQRPTSALTLAPSENVRCFANSLVQRKILPPPVLTQRDAAQTNWSMRPND